MFVALCVTFFFFPFFFFILSSKLVWKSHFANWRKWRLVVSDLQQKQDEAPWKHKQRRQEGVMYPEAKKINKILKKLSVRALIWWPTVTLLVHGMFEERFHSHRPTQHEGYLLCVVILNKRGSARWQSDCGCPGARIHVRGVCACKVL